MSQPRLAAALALTVFLVIPLRARSDVSPPLDLAGNTAKREAAVAELRARLGRPQANGTILFAEPPTVDSLPSAADHPPLADSLTAGMLSVAVGDLDGDGLPDVLGVERADSTLVVRRNLGAGVYGPGARYALALGAYGLVLADFDGDGHLDVGVANITYPYSSPLPHAYSSLRNRGDGTFAARVDGSLTGLPIEVHAADIGHDGHADLIFTLFYHASVDIVRSRADGSFEPAFNLSATTSADSGHNTSADVGDLDGDGNPDIVILYNKGDCFESPPCLTLAVLYGRADGTFEDPLNYQAYDPDGSHDAQSVGLQHVGADQRLDVVVRAGAQPPSPKPAVIRNEGARRLDAPFIRYLSLAPVALARGHFARSGPEDLVFSDAESVSILRGHGDGTFSAVLGVARGVLGAVTDVNGDGLSDIIVTRGDTTEVWLSDGIGGFRLPTVATVGSFLAAANFVGDHQAGPPGSQRWHNSRGRGRALDLSVLMPNGHIGILPGDGEGGFEPPVDFGPADGSSFPLQAVDLDGDGRADLAFTLGFRGGEEDSLVVKWNLGSSFSAPAMFDFGSSTFNQSILAPTDLKVGDFNADGSPDFAVVKGTGGGGFGGGLAIVLNQGHRAFGPPSPVEAAGEDANQAAIADFDGDGSDDIAVAAIATDYAGRYLVFKSVGGELRAMPGTSHYGGYAVEHFATCIATGDFNGDGRADVAIGCGYTYGGHPGAIAIAPNISPPAVIAHTPVEMRNNAPVPAAFRLEAVTPNPATAGRITVAFTLPSAVPAQIEVMDIAGRRVAEREVGSLGIGRHAVGVATDRRLAPGIYLVRLKQGAAVRTTRVAILD